MRRILVTGAAGFVGFHLVASLLRSPENRVYGIDNLNDYYDPKLKKDRLRALPKTKNFEFKKLDIKNGKALAAFVKQKKIDYVVHLAAQAGVRYSIENPGVYVDSNLVGFANILEACRHAKVKHLVYASSSSVYGSNTKMPFSTTDNVDHPISLYAATKKANELMAHTYAHLYRLPVTGLRFFTVYGPWGRPDMSYYLFTKSILEGKPIQVFNEGKMQRDFTYIDDIVEGVERCIDKIPSGEGSAPYRIYNIGNHKPVELMHFIKVLENAIGKKAQMKFLPMQPGDVLATYADIEDLSRDIGFRPHTSIETGLRKFVDWYKAYYKL